MWFIGTRWFPFNRLVTLVLAVLGASSSQVCAQEYGRIDTLLTWKGRTGYAESVRAYYDTVLLREKQPNGIDDFFKISYDAGVTWIYVTDLKRPAPSIPGREINAVGFDYLWEGDPSQQQHFWVIRNGSVVYRDTIGYGHPEYPLRIDRMIIHPTDPKLLFYVGIDHPITAVFHFVYVSADDGRTWRFLQLPDASVGLGRQVQVRFDFSDPSIWYFGITGDDIKGGGGETEWYKTTDEGYTYRSIKSIELLNSMFGPGKSVKFPYGKVLSWQKKTELGNPVVIDIASNSEDTLKWLQNIYTSLFTNSDTTREIVYIAGGLIREETDIFMGYHPDVKGMFIVRIEIDSIQDSIIVPWYAIVATTDMGSTWTWLVKPQKIMTMSAVSIDPKNSTVYLGLRLGDQVVEPFRTYVLMKITPWVSHASSEIQYDVLGRLWPNPTSNEFYVQFSDPLRAEDEIILVDIFGRVAGTGVVVQPQSANGSITIDVRSIPAGTYFVRIGNATARFIKTD